MKKIFFSLGLLGLSLFFAGCQSFNSTTSFSSALLEGYGVPSQPPSPNNYHVTIEELYTAHEITFQNMKKTLTEYEHWIVKEDMQNRILKNRWQNSNVFPPPSMEENHAVPLSRTVFTIPVQQSNLSSISLLTSLTQPIEYRLKKPIKAFSILLNRPQYLQSLIYTDFFDDHTRYCPLCKQRHRIYSDCEKPNQNNLNAQQITEIKGREAFISQLLHVQSLPIADKLEF